MKKYLLMLLITTIFSQEGEIVNATAQQRTDGSGIVDVTYELLPDETFPSFEVSVEFEAKHAFVYWELRDDGKYDFFINTNSFPIRGLWFKQNYGCQGGGDYDISDFLSSFEWSDELSSMEGFQTNYYPGNEKFLALTGGYSFNLNVNPDYYYGCFLNDNGYDNPSNCSDYHNPADFRYIPANTEGLHLFTAEIGIPLYTFWDEEVANGYRCHLEFFGHTTHGAYNPETNPNYVECETIQSSNGYDLPCGWPEPTFQKICGWQECDSRNLLVGPGCIFNATERVAGIMTGFYEDGVPYLIVNGNEIIEISEETLPTQNPPSWGVYTDYIHYPLIQQIAVSGEGVGENIIPGEHSFEWSIPEIWSADGAKLKISAYGHVIDSELPFEMVTIPAGNYYDAYGNVQTMDYSYEIMKYELTNAEFVEYVYSNNILDEGWGEDIGWCFDAISWDGTALEIELGHEDFPLSYPYFDEAGYQFFIDFLEYYGLRLATVDEWLYAARGSARPYYPWSSEDDCWNISVWDQDCSESCLTSAFCIDGSLPFSMEGNYDVGDYNNQSPFGVYDMIGNAQEWIIKPDQLVDCSYCIGNAYDNYIPIGGLMYRLTDSNSWVTNNISCIDIPYLEQGYWIMLEEGIGDIIYSCEERSVANYLISYPAVHSPAEEGGPTREFGTGFRFVRTVLGE